LRVGWIVLDRNRLAHTITRRHRPKLRFKSDWLTCVRREVYDRAIDTRAAWVEDSLRQIDYCTGCGCRPRGLSHLFHRCNDAANYDSHSDQQEKQTNKQ
jgi:hypothetical protein